jgi:hypothetical protein
MSKLIAAATDLQLHGVRVLTSLTQRQRQWLIEARDTPGGAYIGLVSGPEPYELVEAGLATFREERCEGGSRGPRDPRPCTWTDTYLVPTEIGLKVLKTG